MVAAGMLRGFRLLLGRPVLEGESGEELCVLDAGSNWKVVHVYVALLWCAVWCCSWLCSCDCRWPFACQSSSHLDRIALASCERVCVRRRRACALAPRKWLRPSGRRARSCVRASARACARTRARQSALIVHANDGPDLPATRMGAGAQSSGGPLTSCAPPASTFRPAFPDGAHCALRARLVTHARPLIRPAGLANRAAGPASE